MHFEFKYLLLATLPWVYIAAAWRDLYTERSANAEKRRKSWSTELVCVFVTPDVLGKVSALRGVRHKIFRLENRTFLQLKLQVKADT